MIITINKTEITTDINNCNFKYHSPKKALSILSKTEERKIWYIAVEHNKTKLLNEPMTFIQTLDRAYTCNLPIVLSPEIVWYFITNSLCRFVCFNDVLKEEFLKKPAKNKFYTCINTEKFRKKLVLDEIANKIKKNYKSKYLDLFCCDFNKNNNKNLKSIDVSKKNSKSFETILDIEQSFMDYDFFNKFAIPQIHILGAKSDWEYLKKKVDELLSLFPLLTKWNGYLENILDQIIFAFDGMVNVSFWNSLYNEKSGIVSGWILRFFLYSNDWNADSLCIDGIHEYKINDPSNSIYSLNRTPFVLLRNNKKYKLSLVSGIIGTVVEYGALKPIFAIAVIAT